MFWCDQIKAKLHIRNPHESSHPPLPKVGTDGALTLWGATHKTLQTKMGMMGHSAKNWPQLVGNGFG